MQITPLLWMDIIILIKSAIAPLILMDIILIGVYQPPIGGIL